MRGVSKRDGDADMRYFVDANSGQGARQVEHHPHRPRRRASARRCSSADVIAWSPTRSVRRLPAGRSHPRRRQHPRRQGQGDRPRSTTPRAIMTDADNNWGNNAESQRRLRSLRSALRRGVTTWDFYKNDLRPQRHLQRWRGREERRQRHLPQRRPGHGRQRGVVRRAVQVHGLRPGRRRPGSRSSPSTSPATR